MRHNIRNLAASTALVVVLAAMGAPLASASEITGILNSTSNTSSGSSGGGSSTVSGILTGSSGSSISGTVTGGSSGGGGGGGGGGGNGPIVGSLPSAAPGQVLGAAIVAPDESFGIGGGGGNGYYISTEPLSQGSISAARTIGGTGETLAIDDVDISGGTGGQVAATIAAASMDISWLWWILAVLILLGLGYYLYVLYVRDEEEDRMAY